MQLQPTVKCCLWFLQKADGFRKTSLGGSFKVRRCAADGCEITTASVNDSREFILATPWTRFEQVELQKKSARVYRASTTSDVT